MAYAEFFVWVMAFLLFEAYDNVRIWPFSPDLCRLIRDLNLQPVLGTMNSVNEALRIIRVIESTWFDTFPARCRNRGE